VGVFPCCLSSTFSGDTGAHGSSPDGNGGIAARSWGSVGREIPIVLKVLGPAASRRESGGPPSSCSGLARPERSLKDLLVRPLIAINAPCSPCRFPRSLVSGAVRAGS
jgi:hypothetical protein